MPKICFWVNWPIFLSWQISLLCIVEELAGGGCKTVAVGDAVVVAVGFIGFGATIHTCEET